MFELLIMFIESISELTEMVVPLVVDVENKNVTVPEWKDHPVGPEQMKVYLISCFIIHLFPDYFDFIYFWDRHGCDHMVVGFTNTYAISAYHH